MHLPSSYRFVPIIEDESPVGYYELSEPDLAGERYFTQIYVDESRRKEGIGTKTYLQVATELHEHGQRLVSDKDSFSTGALAIWTALESKGLASSSGTPEIDNLQDVRGIIFKAIIHKH